MTQSLTTVAVVRTPTSTGPKDKEATMNRSSSGTRASAAAEEDPPTTTDDTSSTVDGTAVNPTSNTDSTTGRVTTDSD